MVVAGVIGAGLVWGWLLVLFVDKPATAVRTNTDEPAKPSSSKVFLYLNRFLATWQRERRPYLNVLALVLFTVWFAWVVYKLTSATLLIPFFIALILAFAIHFTWRQQLRRAQKSS